MANGFTHNIDQTINPNEIYNGIVDSLHNRGGETWFNRLGRVSNYATEWCLLESTPKVDSYLGTTGNEDQVYRLYFSCVKVGGEAPSGDNPLGVDGKIKSVTVYWGTREQIVDNGSNAPTIQAGTPSVRLWNLANVDAVNELSMRMTVTDRGFVVGVWTIPTVNKTEGNSLLCIQRPVNPKSGFPKQGPDTKSPIFCLYRNDSSATGRFFFSVVREQDVNASTSPVSTYGESANVFYKFTTEWAIPNMYDDYTHVIRFPYGFATSRHLYLDEMDLICLVSSSSFTIGQNFNITMYSELEPRTYSTTYGDLKYGDFVYASGSGNNATYTPSTNIISGGRIAILTAGGGVD